MATPIGTRPGSSRRRRLLAVGAGWALLLGPTLSPAAAREVSVLMDRSSEAWLRLDSPVDDGRLQDPQGYVPGERGGVVHRKLVLENLGPADLPAFQLRVNGRTVRSVEAIRATLGLENSPEDWLLPIYRFWTDTLLHASSFLPQNQDPLYLLNFLGYGLCTDHEAALSALYSAFGVPVQRVPVRGHRVSEYYARGRWQILDGDLNAFYLTLDNQALASFEDVLRDPFLAIRTKVFGKYEAFDLRRSWATAARFEFGEPRVIRPIPPRPLVSPVTDLAGSLYVGETLTYHLDRAPDVAIGKSDLSAWPAAREAALGLLEQTVRVGRRRGGGQAFVFRSAFPVFRIRNETSAPLELTEAGQTVPPGGQWDSPSRPIFSLTMRPLAPDGVVRVFSQGARVALPRLGSGPNRLTLEARSGTRVRVTAVYQPWPTSAAPAIRVTNATTEFDHERPFFLLSSSPVAADRIWWRISPADNPALVPPNLERVQPFDNRITLDPVSETFLSADRLYHLRVRGRARGEWGDWSPPYAFRVLKPRPAGNLQVTWVGPDRLRLSWDRGDEAGVRYLVFGSASRDFVPSVYGGFRLDGVLDEQVTAESRDDNLIGSTEQGEFEAPARYRYFRVIASRRGALSVPSPLARTGDLSLPLQVRVGQTHVEELRGPAPDILLVQHSREDTPGIRNGYRDVFDATRVPLQPESRLEPALVRGDSPELTASLADGRLRLLATREGDYSLTVFFRPAGDRSLRFDILSRLWGRVRDGVDPAFVSTHYPSVTVQVEARDRIPVSRAASLPGP